MTVKDITNLTGTDQSNFRLGLGNYGFHVGMPASFTSSQLLHLASSPVVVIPAPGAGKVNIVLNVALSYHFGSAAYVTPGFAEGLYYQNDLAANGASGTAYPIYSVSLTFTESIFGIGSINSLSGIVGMATSFQYPNGSTPSSGPSVDPTNQPIVFGGQVDDMTTGDGTLLMSVSYLIIPV